MAEQRGRAFGGEHPHEGNSGCIDAGLRCPAVIIVGTLVESCAYNGIHKGVCVGPFDELTGVATVVFEHHDSRCYEVIMELKLIKVSCSFCLEGSIGIGPAESLHGTAVLLELLDVLADCGSECAAADGSRVELEAKDASPEARICYCGKGIVEVRGGADEWEEDVWRAERLLCGEFKGDGDKDLPGNTGQRGNRG